MARRGLARIVAGSALALLAAFAACGGSSDATEPGDAGSDAGAAGSGGTAGSAAGTGGSSGVGGAAGSGGASGAAGSAGTAATPVWKALPDKVAGCTVERLQNPGDLRAFKWKPCDFSADCEEAEWTTETIGKFAGLHANTSVDDDGSKTRIALHWSWSVALFTDESGVVVDGFRLPAVDLCQIDGASIFGDGEAVALKGKTSTNPNGAGGLLASAGGAVATFTLDYTQHPQLVPGYSQSYPLGAARWLWWYGGSDEYLSVSSSDGGDARAVGGHSSAILALSYRSTTGPLFLFDTWYTEDQVTAHRAIYASDGLAEAKPLLVPTDGSDYGNPAFANDYVGWLRGTGFLDVGVYKTTEVWAAKWDPDPSKLVPFKVADDIQDAGMSHTVGGWGTLALTYPVSDTDKRAKIFLYNLGAKTSRSYVLPPEPQILEWLGITRQQCYLMGAVPGVGAYTYLWRLKV